MMTLKDLQIGDIIVNRKGQVGLYTIRKNEGFILYQDGGYDDVAFAFNDDLTDKYEGKEYDIMQVYREYFGGMICFTDYEDSDLIFERDETWKNPNIKEKHNLDIIKEQIKVKNKDLISIIVQCYYGNRTGTEINRNEVKKLLMGDPLKPTQEELDSVNVQTILVPNTKNIVIVYDKNKEDEYVNNTFPQLYAREGADYLERWGEELTPYISCSIPEMNIELHTRCFACRIDEDGILQSLQNDDWKTFIHYFPAR